MVERAGAQRTEIEDDDKEEEEMKPMEIARQWQETGELWVEVYNRRTLCGDEQCRADDFIGTFNIELAEVATHENGIDGWFKLVPPPDDSAAGLFGIKPRAVPGYVKLRMHVRSRRRARSGARRRGFWSDTGGIFLSDDGP